VRFISSQTWIGWLSFPINDLDASSVFRLQQASPCFAKIITFAQPLSSRWRRNPPIRFCPPTPVRFNLPCFPDHYESQQKFVQYDIFGPHELTVATSPMRLAAINLFFSFRMRTVFFSIPPSQECPFPFFFFLSVSSLLLTDLLAFLFQTLTLDPFLGISKIELTSVFLMG